jgi:hypothetical protein
VSNFLIKILQKEKNILRSLSVPVVAGISHPGIVGVSDVVGVLLLASLLGFAVTMLLPTTLPC